MSKKVRITEAEWPIMDVLWERKTATAAEIVEAVSKSRNVSMRTIKAQIRSLIAKKKVSYTVDKTDFRIYHYKATITREQGMEEKNDSILNLVYGGKPSSLLTHFLNNSTLENDEIDDLLALLKKKKAENNS